jgi:hypothetical protein
MEVEARTRLGREGGGVYGCEFMLGTGEECFDSEDKE